MRPHIVCREKMAPGSGQLIKEKEKELEDSNQILNEGNRILSALSRDYRMVLLCDLKQDTFEVVKGMSLHTMTLKKSNS